MKITHDLKCQNRENVKRVVFVDSKIGRLDSSLSMYIICQQECPKYAILNFDLDEKL